MKKTVKEALAENLKLYLRDGPRIRSGYNQVIVARDPEKHMVKLGGLGAMGCGEMWTKEKDYHVDLPGYQDAPIVPYTEEMNFVRTFERKLKVDADSTN